MPKGFRDVCRAGPPQHAYGEIAQTCHDLGAVIRSDPGTVLTERFVPDIVKPVFDSPMRAVDRQQPFRIRPLLIHTCNEIHHLVFGLSRLQRFPNPFHARDLGAIGKVNVAIEFRAAPNSADLQASVRLVHRFVLRGENPPRFWARTNRRYPGGGRAGCL